MAACASPAGPPPAPKAPQPVVLYVASGVETSGKGSRAKPLASLEAALARDPDRIVLLPGVHRMEGSTLLSRPVHLVGERTGGGARLFGRLRVTASRVRIEGLRISGGLDVRFADRVTVSTSTLSAGGGATTVSAVGAQLKLSDCRIEGGRDGALQVSTSTVQVDRSRVIGGPAARVVAAHRSYLSVSRSWITGGGSAQFRLEASALDLDQVHSSEGERHGLVILSGSSAAARNAKIVDFEGTAVMVRNALWKQTGGRLSSRGEVTASAVGTSTVTLQDVRIDAGPRGGLHVLGTPRTRPFASLTDCHIQVPSQGPGLYAESATVALSRTTVQTSSIARLKARTLMEVAGPATNLILDDVELRGGQSLSVVRGAHVRAQGLTLGPGYGGVQISRSSADLRALVARGMVDAPAVWATDSELTVRTATVTSCVAGGIGAGAWTRAELSDLWMQGNLPYALSAVEHADLIVERANVDGRPWALYTDCTGTVRTSSLTSPETARIRLCP